MSIRTKLLLILLIIAVVPMLITLAAGQISTRLVGNRLASKTQDKLIDSAELRLLRIAEDAGQIATSESNTLELVVEVQARAVAEALRAASDQKSLDDMPGIYLASRDFDAGASTIPGLTTNDRHQGQPVSFEAQAFQLAPNTDPDTPEARRDAAALATLLDTYQQLHRANPLLIYGQYTATASGVHATFPGHGGYPDGFDPRKRTWFYLAQAHAIESGQAGGPITPYWGPPIVDASTGQIMLTVSMAVPGPDGRIAAVTAVDIRMRDLLSHLQRPPIWAAEEEILLTSLEGIEGEADPAMLIYAQQSYADGSPDWRSLPSLELFRLDDPKATAQMLAELGAGRAGVIRALRDGVELLCAYVPIGAASGQTDAALIMAVPFSEVIAIADSIDREFWAITVAQLSSNLSIALIVLAGAVIVAFRGARSVTRPIESLASAVERVAGGDLEARADVQTGDELQQLAEHFNAMVPALSDRVNLRHSLDLAMEVQQSLLPKASPSIPGLDIEGRSIYCDETGGDYYDFLNIEAVDQDHLAIVIGDVTGHGIAAALLMTTARAIIHSRLNMPGSFAQHVDLMNAQLARGNDHGRFMTMFFLIIDRAADQLRWVSAGHDPAIIYNADTDTFRTLEGEGDGIPLGIDGAWQYAELHQQGLRPSETLILGTDGIWEARDKDDQLYGKQRLMDVLKANANRAAAEIGDAIVTAVREFSGEVPQLDDITLVVVKPTPNSADQ